MRVSILWAELPIPSWWHVWGVPQMPQLPHSYRYTKIQKLHAMRSASCERYAALEFSSTTLALRPRQLAGL